MCQDVKVEPQFQQLTGEILSKNTANTRGDARIEMPARRFWQTGQQVF